MSYNIVKSVRVLIFRRSGMKEIIISGKKELSSETYNSSAIYRNSKKMTNNRISHIITSISEVTSGVKNFKDIIDPEKEYIAKFPKDVLDKINSGQYDFMKSKNGEILSTIIDKTSPKKTAVHQIRLVEVPNNLVDKVQSLSTNVVTMAIEQQLAQISETLSELLGISEAIKRGQQNDRIGLVLSGKNQLEQALEITDDKKTRDELIMQAIKSLNDGRSQLEQNIKDDINNAISIPSNKLALAFKCIYDSNFYDNVETKFSNQEKGFQVYVYATILLATAYEKLGKIEVLPTIYKPVKELVGAHSRTMIPMAGLVLKGPVDLHRNWFKNSEEFIERIESYNKNALLENTDYITFEITGKELLEG